MATASCPCSGCDYEGEPSSVEAHVSASTDESHQGKVGRDYREEIAESEASGADPSLTDDELVLEDEVGEEVGEEPAEEAAEEPVDGEKTGDEDKPDDEAGDGLDGAGAAAGAAAVGGGSMLMSEDWDVSGTTVAAGVVVGMFLLLAWMYVRNSSSSEEAASDGVSDGESDEVPMGSEAGDGGLVSS